MANELAKLKDLTAAGFDKIVVAVNRLVDVKNHMEADPDLLVWKDWTQQDFEAAGCNPAVAAACVLAMEGLVSSHQTIKAQITGEKFPPNAV